MDTVLEVGFGPEYGLGGPHAGPCLIGGTIQLHFGIKEQHDSVRALSFQSNRGLWDRYLTMPSTVEIASAFIEGAPPGEVSQ